MNIIECTALTKIFQDFWGRDRVRAVDNLDLEVLPGEVFGLLGPNGSGKSTTIKLLLGLLYPTSGAARVLGKAPTNTSIKAHIGFMPEESYLYRYLNAEETLDYYGRLFKLDRYERRRRTAQLIDMVGLKRAAKRPVGTYSKGMARRIGLAQALINDPELLILDEPTTGLDPIGTRQIKEVIKVLGGRGKTVLLCSHLLADVEDVCDRVAIMYGGRRRALGSVHELLERRDTTQITTAQLDDGTIEQIRGLVARSGRKVIAVDHPTDRLEDLFLRVVGRAQREKLETSGAESTGGVSDFLAGKDAADAGASLVASLVAAGRHTESPAASETVSQPVELPAAAKEEVLERLVSRTPTPSEPPSKGPVESPHDRPALNQTVLDRLLKSDSADSHQEEVEDDAAQSE